MVRRAERGVGLAIRKGQAEGAIRRHGERVHHANQYGASPADLPNEKSSSAEFFNGGAEWAQTFAMTDDVSDEQFEDALTEAKDEGKLCPQAPSLTLLTSSRSCIRGPKSKHFLSKSQGDAADPD